jgi:A/G-specific adenine glycosylase
MHGRGPPAITSAFVSDREALRRWYRGRQRAYPWRGPRPDAYRTLVSEVMLQQTQASRVAPAFVAFVGRYPTVRALAAASKRDVLVAWSRLGYNRRAVALADCARTVVRDHGGRIPRSVEELKRLPGIGSYTAAAVASIAFGVPVPALDTNVRRVVSRFHLGHEPHEAARADLAAAASAWLDAGDPGRWNQAIMDLGREVCRPIPRCTACPIAEGCSFRAAGRAPAPAPRRQPPYPGSRRQLRGRIIEALRRSHALSLPELGATVGASIEAVSAACAALASDGLVMAESRAAAAGHPDGMVRLAD